MSDGGPKRPLAQHITLSYALETKVWNLIDGTTRLSLATGVQDRMVP